ncbi:hypothetical protein PIB30_049479 [Stylosanthes scabra]|uniref:Uncharacterized protein n=1 Tax=Stylosanthes scabra TaxID=79078 RepID=A0ABU6QGV2_9FABA|nr:hypothetical protein [Stylosanthes scabra]
MVDYKAQVCNLSELNSEIIQALIQDQSRKFSEEQVCRESRNGNREKKILDFDPEIERLLTKLRKRSKLQKVIQEEISEGVRDNMDDKANNPTSNNYGSSMVRPAMEANNFELKPSLIQLVQQD